MFEYQESHNYFALISRGLEEIAVEEMQDWGVTGHHPILGGYEFKIETEKLYQLIYHSQLLSRVLAPLITFTCRSYEQLYHQALKLDWSLLFSVNQTFAVFASVSGKFLTHSQFAILRLKDAIVDHFKEKYGQRPNVSTLSPDLWIHLRIQQDEASISLDLGGGALHQRFYRVQSVAAPLKENLAAAIVRWSRWQGDRQLIDPMCGSGTILSEALLSISRIPAAFKRKRFGFECLPDFNSLVWEKVKKEAQQMIKEPPPNLIRGSDQNHHAVQAARKNLQQLPFGPTIPVTQMDFRDLKKIENSIILCNPPYGIRQGEMMNLHRLYQDFGDFLKQRCPGCMAWVLCGNRELIPSLGLKPTRRIPVWNGPLECRLIQIEIY